MKCKNDCLNTQAYVEHKTMIDSLAPLTLDLLTAQASEAYVEWIFFLGKIKLTEEDIANAYFPETE